VFQEFKAKKAHAAVLDLRRVPLFSPAEAKAIAGFFLGSAPLFQVRSEQQQIELHQTDRQAVWNEPLVVVTSQLTGRVAEFLAAGLQDYRRALVVGDGGTAGRGRLSSLTSLVADDVPPKNATPLLGMACITGWAIYRLDGRGIQGQGVSADIELPSLTSQPDHREPEQPADRVNPVSFNPRDDVDRALVERLQRMSAERRKKSPWFQRLEAAAAWSRQLAARQSIPLNERSFMKERAAWIASEKVLEELAKPATRSSPSAIARDPYLEEVLAITADYVRILREQPR
jgi:carboxyl-terminal processing protease